ncbi:MAG: DNA polymerase III subunit gamma/tau [Gemmatimonadetes bacterium]|nr:DNA polymerase III subunit gamma/tau [Gemmatimonadota bacterium]MBI3568750.1 DNA polymerase III subunit gamma/tau [Gemmatimonadota bacterium]
MSLALARKYRPKRFADVAVQSHVATTLRNAIASDRIAHAYLFCGPRGTGKTTLARVLAMALNCENRRDDREPCGECASCTRIWSGSASLDVVEIDAASNRGVDDARDLRERAMYAPSGPDHHKVYIIDEAHMLTREAWNALLKILEEPPPRVVFVFATTEPQKIAQSASPVLSRVQRFDLKRIGPADVRERLAAVLKAEGIEADHDALGMLARAADGSMRDALSLTDQVLSLGDGAVTTQRVRDALGLVHEDEYVALLDIVGERRAGDVFTAVARLADFGVDFGLLLAGFGDVLRAQLAIVLGGGVPELSEHLRRELEARKDKFTSGDLLRMLTLIVEIEPHFRRSGQPQMLLETLLVRFALLDRTLDLEEMLRGLGGAAPALPAGGGGTRRAAAEGARPGMLSDSGPQMPPVRAAGAAPGAGLPRPVDAGRSQVIADTAGARANSASSVPGEVHSRSDQPAEIPPPRVREGASGSRIHGSARSAAPIADAAPAARKQQPLDINRLSEHWDDVVEAVRAAGRGVVASALAEGAPLAVTAAGVITIGVSSEALGSAIESSHDVILKAVRSIFDGATRIGVKLTGEARSSRLTAEDVIANRVAMLRKRDPVLDAAVDLLDLRLLD